jgi:HEAT repeat protein
MSSKLDKENEVLAKALADAESVMTEDELKKFLQNAFAKSMDNSQISKELQRIVKEKKPKEKLQAKNVMDGAMFLFGPPNINKMKTNRNIIGLIKALSYQQDSDIVSSAVQALGEIGDERAVGPLLSMLNNIEMNIYKPSIIQEVIRALGKIGSPEAIEPLIYKEHPSEYNEYPTWDALVLIGEPAIGPLIVATGYKNDKRDERRRQSSINTLIKIGKPAIKLLLVSLNNENNNIRDAAIEILLHIGGPKAVKPLFSALKKKYNNPSANWADKMAVVSDLHGLGEIAIPFLETIANTIEFTLYYKPSYAETNLRGKAYEALLDLGWQPDESSKATMYSIILENKISSVSSSRCTNSALLSIDSLCKEYGVEPVIKNLLNRSISDVYVFDEMIKGVEKNAERSHANDIKLLKEELNKEIKRLDDIRNTDDYMSRD